jgi:hypothetical protein
VLSCRDCSICPAAILKLEDPRWQFSYELGVDRNGVTLEQLKKPRSEYLAITGHVDFALEVTHRVFVVSLSSSRRSPGQTTTLHPLQLVLFSVTE